MTAPASATSKRSARILIVDDHPNTASTLARTLGQFTTPVEILTARSGAEALDIINANLVDILITDFMMPGMSGLELIEKLIAMRREPSFTILITAYDSPGLAATARRLKVDEYLVKPFLPDKIRAIVNRVLSGLRQPEAQVAETTSTVQSKILIADDWPDNVQLLATRLQSEGYTFISAADGEEALQKIRSDQPDLVLLDVDMPKKDGFEVLTLLRADPQVSHIPVIMLTAARTAPRDIREGLGLGADDYVTKPFDWRDLAARVRAKLRVKQVEDALRRRNRELGVLPELGHDLSALSSVEDIAMTALRRSIAALQATIGYLVLLDPEDAVPPQLFLPPGTVIPNELRPNLLGKGAIEHVVASRQGLLLEEISTDGRWVSPGDITPGTVLHAIVAVPLVSRRGVVGVLTLCHGRRSYFQTEHLTLLQAIANQSAIAIENIHYYAVEQRRVNELVALSQFARELNTYTQTEEVLERAPTLLRSMLGYPVVSLWIKEGEELLMRTIAGLRAVMDAEAGLRPSLLAMLPKQVAATGEAAIFSGAVDERSSARSEPGRPPTHAAVAVPLAWNAAIQGVIAIHSARLNTFQESDRVLLEMVAAHMAGALERLRFQDKERQTQQWLEGVLAQSSEAFVLLNGEHQVAHISPVAQRWLAQVVPGQALPAEPELAALNDYLQQHLAAAEAPAPLNFVGPNQKALEARLAPLTAGEHILWLRES